MKLLFSINDFYKECVFIDELYPLLWDSLGEANVFEENKIPFIERIGRLDEERFVDMIIYGCRENQLYDRYAINETELQTFLQDIRKDKILAFMSNINLEYIYSKREIPLLILQTANKLRIEADNFLYERGYYSSRLLLADIINKSNDHRYFQKYDITEKELEDWYNGLSIAAYDLLRIMIWKKVKFQKTGK